MADKALVPAGRAYQVVKIDELVRPNDAGGIERYYRHTITTRGGTRLTVDIGPADFTPEKVAPMLAARAADADKILGLG